MAEEEVADTKNTAQPAGLSVAATTTSDGIQVLTAAGEVDHHTADTLTQALDITGTPRVVVNLRLVTFMDSSGINILIAAHRTLTEAGGWLRLAHPTDSVMRVLQLVGIDTIIDCHESLDQALSS
ncbi:STAS domain-containing protein [Streptomyces echinatus]|uniref:STAS domain-containing protein n=1 Tax=Streptomyces echinatus TaxID=67293 RepID=UPI0037B9ED02